MSGTSTHHRWPIAPAREWRQQLLDRTLLAGALLAPLALMPSVVLAWNHGLIAVAISDVLAYALWVAALVTRRVRLEVRAGVIVAVTLHLGVILLFTVGTAGASFVWLAAPLFLALLFLWLPGLIVTGGAIIIALAVCTILLMRGGLAWSVSLESWVVLVTNYVAVTSFLVAAITYLLSNISRSLRDEQIANRERGILISEINHRVKNNLQTMVSLVRLQEAHESDERVGAALGRIELRVLAMSIAHEQIYRDSREAGVSARALLVRVATEAGQRLGLRVAPALYGDDLSIGPEHATPLSLLVVEFLSSCRRPSSDRETADLRIDVTAGTEPEITIAVEAQPDTPVHADAWRVIDALAAQIGAAVKRDARECRLALAIPVPRSSTSGVQPAL